MFKGIFIQLFHVSHCGLSCLRVSCCSYLP